ncbi:MAG: hypothetical protein Q8L20_11345 [Gammaproteobacteria bacterium]|nr:hypothetical protein [Gammaproteobacteria bacterium]
MIGLPTGNDKAAMYRVGFTLADEIEEGLIAEPVWRGPLVLAVPATPPSLASKRVLLDDVLNYRWYFVIPVYEGCSRQLDRLAASGRCVAEHVLIHDLILAMMYDIGLSNTTYIRGMQNHGCHRSPLLHAHHEFVETDCQLTSSLANL